MVKPLTGVKGLDASIRGARRELRQVIAWMSCKSPYMAALFQSFRNLSAAISAEAMEDDVVVVVTLQLCKDAFFRAVALFEYPAHDQGADFKALAEGMRRPGNRFLMACYKPELAVEELLRAGKLAFDSHARDLPGCPDFVIRNRQVAIFCDGDFWHGWRFPLWRLNLNEKWKRRSRQTVAVTPAIQSARGWIVVRLWEHEIKRDLDACLERILAALRRRP
jgi:DNA mismatch endonuclease, patch repair protein